MNEANTFLSIMGAAILVFGWTSWYMFKKNGIYNPDVKDFTDIEILPVSTETPPITDVTETTPTGANTAPQPLLWDTPVLARHSFRVICDEMGVTVPNKNLLTAVVMAESQFYNTAKNVNKRPDGSAGSTDWGICQINDRFHIGAGKTFPSVDYVLANPDKVVRWMVEMFRAGRLSMWCAYTNNSYKKYL